MLLIRFRTFNSAESFLAGFRIAVEGDHTMEPIRMRPGVGLNRTMTVQGWISEWITGPNYLPSKLIIKNDKKYDRKSLYVTPERRRLGLDLSYSSLPTLCIVFLIFRSSVESVSSLSGVSRRLFVSGFEPLSKLTFSSINGMSHWKPLLSSFFRLQLKAAVSLLTAALTKEKRERKD